MGRRCCCESGCHLIAIGDIKSVNDFTNIFSTQDDFTVSYNVYDSITFTGSANLTLSRPDLIFSEDNFAITLDGSLSSSSSGYVTIDNLSDGDQITENITFTLGLNKITIDYIRTNTYIQGSRVGDSFVVKYNNTLLYTLQNNGATNLDHIVNILPISGSLLQATHYLIRKEGSLYYYIDDYLVGVCPDDNINTPVVFSYAFTSTNPDATITFKPNFLQIWKPDKWWKFSRYKEQPKPLPTNPSSSLANELYDIIAYNELESEGCLSPESPIPDVSVRSSNDDVKFSELSPKIAIQFSGIKSSKSYIPAIPIRAEWYESGYDEYGNWYSNTHNELDTVYDDIVAEETTRADDEYEGDYDDNDYADEVDYDTINGLKTKVLNLDGIMTSQAGAWKLNKIDYLLEWYNGAVVRLKYNGVHAQILNGVKGGDKVTFQQMTPVTVMRNNEWYYTDRINEYNHSFHQGFRGYNSSWGHWTEENLVSKYYSWEHVGGSLTNLCRLDPFAYYYSLNNTSSTRTSYVTDTFAICDTTLEFRKGIVAPDIDVNVSSGGLVDIIFNKPNTTPFTTANWLIPHIVKVSNNNNFNFGASQGTTTITWYSEDNINPVDPAQRDTTSPLGGYFKIQYSAFANPTSETDTLVYLLEDQFGAKSLGRITIHFTGSDTHVVQEVAPIRDSVNISDCSDYDTLCEVKCDIPYALTSALGVDVYLHYVHEGKTCQLSDLIDPVNPISATLKMPSPWTSIDGVLQDSIQVTFVNPVHTDCDLAHDNNFGLENSFLNSGEPDNVDHIVATIQIWDKTDPANPFTDGQPFTINLNPTEPVGCPSSQDIGISHNANVSTVYSGEFQYTITANGTSYTDTAEVSLGSHYYQSIPYGLGEYIRELKNLHHTNNHGRAYEVTKLKIVYVSNKEIEIDLHSLAPCPASYIQTTDAYDYPKIVIGDFYND